MGRSKWKGFFIQNNYKKSDSMEIINKNTNVIPKLINKTCLIHTGKKFAKIIFTQEMLGHKIGEFVMTRANYIFKIKKKNQKNIKKIKKLFTKK